MQQLVLENSNQNNVQQAVVVVISEPVVVLNEIVGMCVAVRRALFTFDHPKFTFDPYAQKMDWRVE